MYRDSALITNSIIVTTISDTEVLWKIAENNNKCHLVRQGEYKIVILVLFFSFVKHLILFCTFAPNFFE